mmetsp:Transcript_13319/g.25043  ORF Transcript_13319/g.25043 Transcript_13319/m.25043 type:complete len:109 (+) Transcript_13319:131-457(+)
MLQTPTQKHFLVKMKPSGLFGEAENPVHCLLVRDSLFIRAESPLTRAPIGRMSDLAKTHEASVLYAATYRQTPDFLKTAICGVQTSLPCPTEDAVQCPWCPPQTQSLA